MTTTPASIITLTAALAKLPGVGPRSAERIALHLVQAETAQVQHLAGTILMARARGWRAILHETPEKTRAALENYLR